MTCQYKNDDTALIVYLFLFLLSIFLTFADEKKRENDRLLVPCHYFGVDMLDYAVKINGRLTFSSILNQFDPILQV